MKTTRKPRKPRKPNGKKCDWAVFVKRTVREVFICRDCTCEEAEENFASIAADSWEEECIKSEVEAVAEE